jgi:hypothetical protein
MASLSLAIAAPVAVPSEGEEVIHRMSKPKAIVQFVTLATDLVGSIVVPQNPDHIGQSFGTWPFSEPNLSGEHYVTVRAAWIHEGSLKLLGEAPTGKLFELFAVHVKTR